MQPPFTPAAQILWNAIPPHFQEPQSETLQPGDKVIWWKRIPGGDYVYPVQATVLALMAKQVKVEADDDGKIGMRYVPPQNLQRQG